MNLNISLFDQFDELEKYDEVNVNKRKRLVDADLDKATTLADTLYNEQPMVIEEEAEEEEEEMEIVPETLEEYALDDTDKIFINRLKQHSKLADPKISEIPPVVDAFKYISKLTSDMQPPWFVTSQKTLLENHKNAPELVSLTRAYIRPFLVEHNKLDPSSVPCASPPGQCESELHGKFRCRALLFPNQIALSDRIGYCYLCHLFKTNSLYIESRDRSSELEDKDMFCIHSFIVHVNVVGEYRLEHMIPGTITGRNGLFGPFPVYNRNNYTWVKRASDGLRHWVENDALVFRLPQVALDQNKC